MNAQKIFNAAVSFRKLDGLQANSMNHVKDYFTEAWVRSALLLPAKWGGYDVSLCCLARYLKEDPKGSRHEGRKDYCRVTIHFNDRDAAITAIHEASLMYGVYIKDANRKERESGQLEREAWLAGED